MKYHHAINQDLENAQTKATEQREVSELTIRQVSPIQSIVESQ